MLTAEEMGAMRRPLPPIQEPLEALQARLRQCRDGRLKWRLQLLVLMKQGAVQSRQAAAQRLAQHRNTIGRWLRAYERAGLEGLLHLGQAGAPVGGGGLSTPIRQTLQERLREPNGFRSYTEVRHWLSETYGQRVPYSTVHRWVRDRLKAKLKRPRPTHPKKTAPRRRPSPSASPGDSAC